MIHHRVLLAPRIPQELTNLHYHVKVGGGTIEAEYSANSAEQLYTYRFKGIKLTAVIDIAPFDELEFEAEAETELRISRTEQVLAIELVNSSGEIIRLFTVEPSAARIEQQLHSDQHFAGVHFAEPLALENHPVMERKITKVVETEE
ncbi:hypothetical protein D3C75_712620 [compost metagenome]